MNNDSLKKMGFATKAIHAGNTENTPGTLATPIYQTSTFYHILKLKTTLILQFRIMLLIFSDVRIYLLLPVHFLQTIFLLSQGLIF